MAAKLKETSAGLKELVRDQGAKLQAFSQYLLPAEVSVDEFLLDLFREFAGIYRNYTDSGEASDPLLLRRRLYQLAWSRIRGELSRGPGISLGGRDTRELKEMDSDLLESMKKARSAQSVDKMSKRVIERLRRVDPDLRVVVVLRDILGLEDEAVAATLGLRWGVYRHRLHRGRLELVDHLKGRGPSYPSIREGRQEESLW